jgi:hypothetical protein
LVNASPLGWDVVGQTLKSKRCGARSQTRAFDILELTFAIAKIDRNAKIAEIERLYSQRFLNCQFLAILAILAIP